MKMSLIRYLAGCAALLFLHFSAQSQDLNPSQWPSLAGYWKFQDTGNLVGATVGNDLQLVGTHHWTQGAYYGDTAVSIAIGSYYRCDHEILPNGGGDSVNRYTLMFDFMVQNFERWHTFQQTDSTNMNDGECFIKPQATGIKSTIGTATTGYTPDSITPGIWYRMVISVCLDSFYRYYIDGVLWHEGNLQVVDGRFALTPVLLFFADNNQEDDTIQIGSMAVFNKALSAGEVAMLGGLDPCIANPPVIDLGSDIIVCASNTALLDAGSGYKTYSWSTGATTQQLVLDTSYWGLGSSIVTVEAVNMNDCVAGDSILVTFIDCTSIAEAEKKDTWRMYPNPATDQLMVEFTDEGEFTVQIFDLAGSQIAGYEYLSKGLHTFDISALPVGIYLVKISGGVLPECIRLLKINE